MAADLPPPLNHVFVDFENVHEIDLAVIGNRAVSFTLLIGPRQTKLEVGLVEKLFEHATSVQLVRLASTGRNALDFILTYYVGRAVAFDPAGCFHIVSRDTGFDPLIEHLVSKRIHACRHDSFATLNFDSSCPLPSAAMTAAPSVVPKPKPKAPAKPKATVKPLILDEWATRALDRLREPSATFPKNKKKMVSYLVAYFGRKITEAQALNIIETLHQAGHVAVDEKDRIAYHLKSK